ncbi:XRE family transcriptional regulator [Alteriqipengyuania lutimaris]|uniref:XRE family transcriptional regulator n=1 Tax=Alteriqipengyuania lutimaris TaxID=1538146 RepID=UPI0015F188E3|nr:XRE family transcriptional regulator [Alteriqipengyuania lutimaris]MBB3035401.1 phage repressor protein C with HTH and peptisase S24 domain [Alteriqipengyuania lutimaris]
MRIEELLAAKGLSQSELARRVGVSQHSIWHLINKGKTGSRHITKIARELETSVAYLEGETDDPEADAPLPGAPRENMVEVAMVDLAYGMGGTFLSEHPDSRMEEFPLSFLRNFTKADPGQLMIAEGVGDSMAPTIGPSDLVLIDRGQNNLNIDDRIWACAIGEIGMIKRLRVRGDTVTLLSDNANVPEDRAADGELHLIGRVVGKFSRL